MLAVVSSASWLRKDQYADSNKAPENSAGIRGALGKSPKNDVELRCNYRFQSEWGHGPSEYMRKHDIYSDYRGERGVTLTGNGSKIQWFSHILSRFGCENKGIRWSMIFMFFTYAYQFSSKLHPLIHIWKGCPSLAVAEIGSRCDCTFFILFLFMDSYGVIVPFSSFFIVSDRKLEDEGGLVVMNFWVGCSAIPMKKYLGFQSLPKRSIKVCWPPRIKKNLSYAYGPPKWTDPI